MIVVACEYSGRVRDSFNAKGYEAISCDLLPSESSKGPHVIGDALAVIAALKPKAVIAFPPCTYLAASGIHWNKTRPERAAQTEKAVLFVKALWECCEIVAIENPVGVLSTLFRKPSQYIQPWQHGHGETKKTGLWLKGLPLLRPTKIVAGRVPRVHLESPGDDRWKRRSLTLQGIADAMAEQWGPIIEGA